MGWLIDRLFTVPIPLALLVFLLPALEGSLFVGFIFRGEIAILLGGSVLPTWIHTLRRPR